MTTLDVRFSGNPAGPAQYFYTLKRDDGATYGPLAQEYPVEVNQSLIRALCNEIDGALAEAGVGAGRLHERLRTEGMILYRQLLQSREGSVPELVRALHETTDPLVVQTNEDVVPWELLHDGEQFLGLSVDLGRRSVVNSHVTLGRDIGPIRRALVVGDTLGDLPKAREEVERISGWLDDQGIDCTVLLGAEATQLGVIRALAAEEDPYDLFHFSGHVSSAPEATGLMVHRRELIDNPTLRTLSGRGAPPVVFINGCASAAFTMSVCKSFMLMGAKTVVGTRSAVDDESAARFAQDFYGRLQQRLPAGAAMRESRAALAAQQDGSWAAFVLYGDPAARITAQRRPSAAPASPPPSSAFSLAADARALILRMTEISEPRTLATSIDLLAVLLETKEIQERSLPRVGPHRLEMLRHVLGRFQDGAAAATAEVPPQSERHREVELSDTVAEVLALANETVALAGRRSISVDDVAAALLKVGGSACADVLNLCGISMEEVLAPPSAAVQPGPEQSVVSPAAIAGGAVQLDALDPNAAAVIQCARLLAVARREPVSSYLVLKAFAVVESRALRHVLELQGPEGDQALRRLAALGAPRAGEFTQRVGSVLSALSSPDERATQVGEAELLRALLTDPRSSARSRLNQLGIDSDRVIRALSA